MVCGMGSPLAFLSAQTTLKIYDEASGDGLPFVKVSAQAKGSSSPQYFLTDQSGSLRLEDEGTAIWQIKLALLGFEEKEIFLEAGQVHSLMLRPQTKDLDPVVITGQYGGARQEDAVHAIRIVDSAAIARMAAVNVGDVLEQQLNIRLSQDNILGQGLSMQGISGQHVNILIDGVPVIGRQDGEIDLGQLNLLEIERIEIVEGPLSVNYGSNALAGTINLITKKGAAQGAGVQLSSYQETIGTYNQSLAAQWSKGKNAFRLSGGRNFFDGWSPGDGLWPQFDQPVADSTRFQAWKPKTQWFSRLTYTRQAKGVQYGYKAEVFDEFILNRGLPRAPYQEAAFDDTYQTRRINQQAFAQGSLADRHHFSFVAAYNDFRREKHTYAKDLTNLEQTESTTPGSQDTSLFRLWMSRGQWAYGQEAAKARFELGYELNHETAKGLRIGDGFQDMSNYALFGSLEYRPWKGLLIRPGVRVAHNSAYQAPVIPSLNLKFQRGSWSWRAAYARGFRAPSLKELHFFFVDINHNIVGNPDLQAEFSHHLSTQLRFRQLRGMSLWTVQVNAFYNDLDNMIALALMPDNSYTYQNITDFRTQGLNGQLSLQRDIWQAQVGASYTGRYNRLSESQAIETFSYYPEMQASVGVQLAEKGPHLNVFYRYQGRLPGFRLDAEGNLGETFIAPYHLADANLSQRLWQQKMTLTLGAKNLFDVRNVASQASAGVHGGSATAVPVATGRMFFLKLDLNL